MINPPAKTLRRRAVELHDAADRERVQNPDTAALLLFYSAECGLKAVYMLQNGLKNTADARGSAQAARSFLHDILRLTDALRIPRSVFAPQPDFVLRRTRENVPVIHLHEAWRYGEQTESTDVIIAWLLRIYGWIERNL